MRLIYVNFPIERVVLLAPLAQPQRTAPFSDFRGGRPCLDIYRSGALAFGASDSPFFDFLFEFVGDLAFHALLIHSSP